MFWVAEMHRNWMQSQWSSASPQPVTIFHGQTCHQGAPLGHLPRLVQLEMKASFLDPGGWKRGSSFKNRLRRLRFILLVEHRHLLNEFMLFVVALEDMKGQEGLQVDPDPDRHLFPDIQIQIARTIGS